MAGIQDFWCYQDDFFGSGATIATTASPHSPWVVTDTSSAGTPTYTMGVDNGQSTGTYVPGEAVLTLDSTSEIQNVCLSWGDVLGFDIDKVQGCEWAIRQGQATIDAATSIAFGLAGDRNDAIDSIANHALFRLIGTNSVVVETDDGTTDNDDVATGQTLTNSYKIFKIDFSNGTSDVRFFMGDGNGSLKRVASSTTFDLSGYTAALQPFLQIQKTADTNTDAVRADYIKVWGTR